ncbi:MAG: YhfC family intramembrane metalloprotease [Chloroflexota bacterium]|nr:MAG: YhfC family intramembrane metalloprotease [Chloroflexota bacterium]
MRPFVYLLNFLLMISMPLLLGWLIARRRHVSWRLFVIGAVTFVLSQVVHIPFNYLVSTNLPSQITQLPDTALLLLSALFLGLSAGIFEEGARYLSFRFWAADARTWGRGLMVGAGHGGAESILLGLLGALNVWILFGYQAGFFQTLIPEEQAPQVQEVLLQMASIPWFEALFGALERLFVLCIQMGLSLMVMQVFIRGRVIWLVLAIVWHALIDAAAVMALSLSGVYAAEAITALAALVSLLFIASQKEPEPVDEEPEPLPRAGPAGPIQIEPTSEKLEESRYV